MAIHDVKLYPENIAVIGGGRWARVLTEVLCGMVPSSATLSVHSAHNAKGMETWALERGLDRRLTISALLPDFSPGSSSAVIVVNAARDHEDAVTWSIATGVPVLVEKPLTMNYNSALRLSNAARRQGTYLATAHVFLFAGYLERFAKLVRDADAVRTISVRWMDPPAEQRYGEAKNYDPGLTIFADWLPHVVSIIGTLTDRQFQQCENLKVFRGGAELELELSFADLPCKVFLARNGDVRQRIVEVATRTEVLTLDFSCEPGTITSCPTTTCADPEWNLKARPVARMLQAFLQGAAGGGYDGRLDSEIGVCGCKIIDEVASLYRAALSPWVESRLRLPDYEDADLRYALTELIHAEDPHSPVPIEQRIRLFRST